VARKKRDKLRQPDIGGLKFFDVLAPLLERLHDVGCERDKAGNRLLHYDQYCMLLLLYLFNPTVVSLRAIQQASELSNVQKRLGCPRASLGSLSEATQVFDPERLKEVIHELGGQLRPLARDPRLKNVPHALTLVDGTLLAALPHMAQACLLKQQTGSGLVKWRLHTQFEVDRHIPTRMDLTDGSGRGPADERDVLEGSLQSDRCYVMDRGYAKFTLFNAIRAAGSSYVCRIRDNSHWEKIESRPLTDEDRAAGVLSDQIVQLGNRSSSASARMDHPVRVILIPMEPHPKRGKTGGGSAGHPSDGMLRIVTNLMDVPAWIIALIYRYRWTIEIFFRFFKHILGCRHLLSHDQAGIQIQTYCAIIACLLINLWTGRKPTLRTYEMICHYLSGWASEEELFAHFAKLKPATPTS
jgi:DDE family transposase